MKQDTALIVSDVTTLSNQYCAYEHLAVLEAGKPPEVIFASVCKLIDVYRMTEGKRNSEWVKLFGNGGSVMVRIIMTSESRTDVIRFLVEHIKTLPDIPRCNKHGVSYKGSARRVLCSNGESYASQLDAAKALGVSASAISRHMRGELRGVAGYTFTYEARR